jgi:hypothetical protein
VATPEYNVTSHHVPKLEEYQAFLRVIEGESDATLRGMSERIEEHKGTPQEPTDWSEPGKWIAEFHAQGTFTDTARDLASKLHNAGLNPRHWRLDAVRRARRDGTLGVDSSGCYRVTAFGRDLGQGDAAAVDRYLTANGMYAVLSFLRDEDGQTLESLLPRWQHWVNTVAGKSAQSRGVLSGGIWWRLNGSLIPLSLVKQEGVPRRYFLTPEGAAKATEISIEQTVVPGPRSARAHEVAVKDILKVGELLGYRTRPTPALRDLLPRAEQQNATARVYNKQIDACWTAELPLLGEIRVAIEVQDKGGIPDLVSRLKVVAPFCHYLIIISDEKQIAEIQEHVAATGDEKTFKAKTVWMTPEQLQRVRQEVNHLSSVLTPSDQAEPEDATGVQPDAEAAEDE